MRLVHDHGKALARKLADLLGDDGEFLQGGHDDRPSGFQGLAELARSLVDVLHHAQGLLELPDGLLELAVEHTPVGHDHDRVEDASVIPIVQHRELVGQPGDGEALAAARRVLDQVALAGAVVTCVAHKAAHAVELLVARKDQVALAGLAPAVVLRLDLVDELADEVEQAVPGPDLLPQVIGWKARTGGWDRWIPRAPEAPPVEGQKSGGGPCQPGGHEHQLRVHGEVGQAAPVGEERLPGGAVLPVLPDGVLHVLAVERILELCREDGDAVQKDCEVQAVLTLLAVAELAHLCEEVGRVQPLQFLVKPARWPEVGQPEPAAHVLHAVAQHVERPPPADLAREPPQEARLHLRTVVLLQPLPLLRLGGQQEVEHVARNQAEPAVVVLRPAPEVAARRWVLAVGRPRLPHRRCIARAGVGTVPQQRTLDRLLEGTLGDLGTHDASSRTRRSCR